MLARPCPAFRHLQYGEGLVSLVSALQVMMKSWAGPGNEATDTQYILIVLIRSNIVLLLTFALDCS